MSEPIKILGIAGSLRAASYNKAALKAAQGMVPPDVTLDAFDLAGLPLFNQDTEAEPNERVAAFKKAIRAADAILICSPEYNYSIPGVLKNAIDCASRPYGDNAWSGKPVALIGASAGKFGGVRAQAHLRQCFVFLDLPALNKPEVTISEAAKAFDAAGKLTDETSTKLIRQLLENLAAFARQSKNR